MAAYINAIGQAVPDNKIKQIEAYHWMCDALEYEKSDEKRILNLLYQSSGIENRYSVIADYARDKADFEFFPKTKGIEPFPTVKQRMQLYKKEALPLALKAIENCFETTEFNYEDITHIITVSCTGMYAPGIDIELIDKLHLNKHVERFAIQFMGCYAAINGLKAANHICHSQAEAKVLVVCVELCSLHFLKTKSKDQWVSNALFGDGAAAILVSGKPSEGVSLEIEKFYCDIDPSGHDDMAWQIGDMGFEMALTSYVPVAVKSGIGILTQALLEKTGLKRSDIDYFAVHPGGKKILEAAQEALEMTEGEIHFSKEILSNYGNMSSPSVIFVLNSILKQLKHDDQGKNILGFAFGPGLTIESLLLKVNYV